MQADSHIRLLPIQVANRIAAGEVVERPASVVKELMENAIDAGASAIEVSVTAGGRKQIRVSDDGSGMSRDDALLSIERHATSKIRDVHDIETIATLGFRGEAMAAIASVSRLRLTTCARGAEAGTEIRVAGGTVQDVREGGFPPGTAVEVRDLFFNVPARRKFLRTEQTELFHIRDVFMVQALSHPSMDMRLTIDGRDLYRLPAATELDDRIRELFSAELLQRLRPVEFERDGIRVTGRVSAPTAFRADRNEQYVFVNGRATDPALLAYAIGEGYRGILPKGRHPSVFLFLEMNPGSVDVNVHPTKREIRFRHPARVRDAVIAAIQQALDVSATGSSGSSGEAMPLPAVVPPAETSLEIAGLPPAHAFSYPRRQMPFDPPAGGRPVDEVFGAPSPSPTEGHAPVSTGSGSAPWSWCRVLGQIGGYYVVLETETGLVLMDPRSAHERVLFERLMGSVQIHRVESQALLIPESVTLSARDADRVRKQVQAFQNLGIGISEFGGNSFMVDAIPACFGDVPVRPLIENMAAGLEQAGSRGGIEAREEQLAQAACRAAVGCRQRLSLEEIERLVVDLAQCEMPYTSPRGRQTLHFTALSELHHRFGRDG